MPNYQGTNVLVTGAGGFVGAHLCEALHREGAHVRAFLHYHAQGNAGWLDHSTMKAGMELYWGDLRDRDSLLEAMLGAEIVFHLGALISVPYSFENPAAFLQTNTAGTMNVLVCARELDVQRVIHTSTSEVYGTAQIVPIPEHHPKVAQSPYAASKTAADQMCQAFSRMHGFPTVVTLRPFNTFGPRQSTRAVLPAIIVQALHGTGIRLGDTTTRRDMNYVQNSIDAYLLAGKAELPTGTEINIGTGEDLSIGDMVEIVGEYLGKQLSVIHDLERMRPENAEVKRLIADRSFAREILDWEPRVSTREGIRLTVDWMREHPQFYSSRDYRI